VSQFTVNANGFVVANNGYQSGTWFRSGNTATVPVGAAVNQPGIALSIVSATPALPTAGVQLYATTSSLLGIATSLGTLSMSASQMNTSRTDYTLFTSPTTLNIGQAGAGYTLNLATQSISSTGTSIINIGTGSSGATGAVQLIYIGTGRKTTGSNAIFIGANSLGDTVSVSAAMTVAGTSTYNGNAVFNGNITASSNTITASSVIGGGLDLVYSGTFTSASNVSVDNVFTTKYNNYKVIVVVTSVAGTPFATFNFRLRTGGSESNSNYIGSSYGIANGVSTVQSGATTGFFPLGPTITSNILLNVPLSFELSSPAASSTTGMYSMSYSGTNPGATYYMSGQGYHNFVGVMDGISINSGASALLYTGTIRVYGYHN
jgi:hypothetical protein